MFIAIDVCFHLKWRLVSSEAKDPGLGTGWTYFVENKPFKAFVAMLEDQHEVYLYVHFFVTDILLQNSILNYSPTPNVSFALDITSQSVQHMTVGFPVSRGTACSKGTSCGLLQRETRTNLRLYHSSHSGL